MPMFCETVAERRDLAIERVATKADEVEPGWSDRAYAALTIFCAKSKEPFIAEDVRAWAEGLGLISAPHDARAWGAVMQKACRRGLVSKVGFAPAKSSNLSPKVLWEAAGV